MNGRKSELVAERAEDSFVIFTGRAVGIGKDETPVHVVVFELGISCRDLESLGFKVTVRAFVGPSVVGKVEKILIKTS